MTNKLPWVEKYRPANTSEVVGQAGSVKAILDFVQNFKQQPEKAILLTGPVGSGKTSIAIAVAEELGYELIQMNASDYRKKDQIEAKIGCACNQQSLIPSNGKLILVDEVDGVHGNSDRGGMATLGKIVDKTCFPMILTATDKWNQKLRTLKKKCRGIDLRKVDIRSMAKRLGEIAEKEGMNIDETVIAEISRRAEGDLRSAINDIETLSGIDKITMKDLENEIVLRAFSILCLRFTNPKILKQLCKVFGIVIKVRMRLCCGLLKQFQKSMRNLRKLQKLLMQFHAQMFSREGLHGAVLGHS
jgi:replication factor C large subunit